MFKEHTQFGCITYPSNGSAREFVLAWAPASCTIVWCDGYAKLMR